MLTDESLSSGLETTFVSCAEPVSPLSTLPPGTTCTVHVIPLSGLIDNAGRPPTYSVFVPFSIDGVPPQPLTGKYAVPSGPTLRWPCSAEQAPPSTSIVWLGSSIALAGVL